MKGEIKHPLSAISQTMQPATASGMTNTDYTAILQTAVHKLRGREIDKGQISLSIFTRWLAVHHTGKDAFVVTEDLISKFSDDLETGVLKRRDGKAYQWDFAREVRALIVRLHNIGRDIDTRITRTLVTTPVYERLQFFGGLSATSQKLLLKFESQGKRAKVKFNRNQQLMTVATRQAAITSAFCLIRELRHKHQTTIQGLEEITSEHVSVLTANTDPADPDYRRIARLLHSAQPVFRFGTEEGFLNTNPLQHIDSNQFTNYAQRDFLGPEEITKAFDLESLDRANTQEVTDRLAVLLLYDLAVRLGEIACLELRDIKEIEPGNFTVQLRTEVQKMANKPQVDLPILFPETSELLGYYLKKIRPRYPGSKLLIDSHGEEATRHSIINGISRVSKKLDLRTYLHKAHPSAHCFRRTFGTLNTAGLGLKLSPDELAARMRDRIDVTYKHYVQRNPLVSNLQAEELRRRINSSPSITAIRSAIEVLVKGGIPSGLATKLQNWEKTQETKTHTIAPTISAPIIWVTEMDALKMLAEHWSTLPSKRLLRAYIKGLGAQSGIAQRSGKYGRVVFNAEVIRNFANNYEPVRDHLSGSQMRRSILKNILGDFQTLKLGREHYISRNDFPMFSRRLKEYRDGFPSDNKTCQTYAAKRVKQVQKCSTNNIDHAA